MRCLRLLVVVLFVCVSVMAAENPFSGTWKFNPAKGHNTPPVPKSQMVTIEADKENFKFTSEGIDDKDQPFKAIYEAKFDGKDYPFTGDPTIDTVSLRRVNDHEIKITTKKAGKVVADLDVVVSKDGKTTMVNYTDKGEKGTSVYDKQ